MLRPLFQRKLRLAFLMLASALLFLAEPVFARKDNRSSSGRENAQQQTAPAPAPIPSPAPPAPIPQPSSVSRPTVQAQSRSAVSIPSISAQPQSSTHSRVITNNPSISVRPQPSTQSRSITSSPSVSAPSLNVITTTKPSQPQTSSTNTISTNRNISSRTTTNNSISQNNVISNRSREIADSTNRASQPVASPNTRISSELSSNIGDTIGAQPKSTTNIRKQESNSSRNPVYLPFDRESDSQRTSPQIKAQQPAESSNNRINSELRSRIGTQINAQNDSQSRNTRQSNNSVTPPLNSERQPVENARSRSSLDRANTDLGVMISPERTPSIESRQPAAKPNDRTTRNRSNIGTRIGEQDTPRSTTQIRNYVGDLERTNSSIGNSAKPRERTERVDSQARDISRGTVGDINTRADRRVERPQVESGRPADDSLSSTRISRDAPGTQSAITDLHVRDSDGRRDLRVYRYEPVRPTRIIVRDRPYYRDTHRDSYIYVDLHNRVYTRTITPSYYVRICYDRGSWLTFRYVYPYYQRKYVFVSLGGYWPWDYSYIRYYWYGSHPYNWYGYYPVAREVGPDVNYYTYNYYYGDTSGGYDTGRVIDSEYFNTTTRQPAPQPAEATLADTYFDEAVNAFEKGKYDLAIEKFSKAMALAPDDMILPYAYSQALFAAERYSEAAQVLRKALDKVKPEQEGVFYPRGLYPNDDELLAQLDKLSEYVEKYSFDADLQLLLGYQLLGIGELDKALTPLRNASLDMNNQKPADVLLNLLLKIKVNDITSGENIEPEKIDSNEIEPNTIQLNKVEPVIRDVQNFTFLASENSAPVVINENEAAEITDSKIVSEVISADEPTNKKAKEGILLATLFVLAGSTGLGHFLHR